MTHRDVELLAIGAGPSNLALAVAIEETAPDLAERTLVLERDLEVSWQRGMLLPEAQSQVSFLKDLVTLRDPRSRFSFVNYLHSEGRLHDFANMGQWVPFRSELSGYFQWVADNLRKVRVECGTECLTLEARRDEQGSVVGWLARLSDGSTVSSRFLVLGTGRDAHVPEVFRGLPAERVVHSTQYLPRIAELDRDAPLRVTVIGGAQSAAEMFAAVQEDLPRCRPTMVMRSIGLNAYESSKFTNELFYPSFTDVFFEADERARAQILAEMHRTNYAGLAPATLDKLYRQFYLDRLGGEGRLTMRTMTDVLAAREVDGEVALTLRDRRNSQVDELRTDLVLLGTGFDKQTPRLARRLVATLGLDQATVTRHYRLVLPGSPVGACYLQGVNEATHGIADSLLSVLAVRAEEILADVRRQLETPTDPVDDGGPVVDSLPALAATP